MLELGAMLFGVLQGILIMFNKRINWIAYIIQMIFLVLFSLSVGLYGDAFNSFCYIFVGILGFIVWTKKDDIYIGICSWKERFIYILLISLGTFLLYLFLVSTDDPLPLIDAFTTISSFVATYYMIIKKIDTWIIWFVNDIFYCLTYWLLPDQALYLFTLNVVWTVMAIFSFINWYKIRISQQCNKLYFGGTFCFDYLKDNYKEDAGKDYRAILLGDSEKLLQKQDFVSINLRNKYIGPFYFECDKMVDELIVKTEIEMIKKCSHAIFLLNDANCPGTIAELILASSLNKNVVIFYVKKSDDEETESNLHSPCWFPILVNKLYYKNVQIFSCESYNHATKKIIDYVDNL